jgi:hypothetical protein
MRPLAIALLLAGCPKPAAITPATGPATMPTTTQADLELKLTQGVAATLPDGLRVELVASGYLHAPGGVNVFTCNLSLTRGEATEEITLAREVGKPLEYTAYQGWSLAVVDAEAYQKPNTATVAARKLAP